MRTIRDLKRFFGTKAVTFRDDGKGETYTITKDNKKLTLYIFGTPIDGGWLSTKIEEVE